MYDPIHDRYTRPEASSSSPPAQSASLPSKLQAPAQPEFSVSFDFDNADEPSNEASNEQDRSTRQSSSPERKRKRTPLRQSSESKDVQSSMKVNEANHGDALQSSEQQDQTQREIEEQERKRLKRYEKKPDREKRVRGMDKEAMAGAFARREVVDRQDRRPRSPPNDDNHYRPARRGSTLQYKYNQGAPLPHLVHRDPSPEAAPVPRSPPRKLKRPGARFSQAERDRLRREQESREVEREMKTVNEVLSRGVDEVVKAHYNAVPERGKEWRKTDSKISGLRSYNNWVKSTLIQKFAANDDYVPGGFNSARLKVLDIGCGKGGDLLKWKSAPQSVELYVGVDSAEISIRQAKERYVKMHDQDMRRNRGRPADKFHAEFYVMDAWTQSVGDIRIVDDVVNHEGGFDVVSMMFCLHYAFESEDKIKGMLRNISNSLCRGGRFIGTIPSSDIIYDALQPDKTEFGNSLYRVSFPKIEGARKLPDDGAWRPAWGWKYSFFLQESVEDVPEYVVPWEAFRFLAGEFGLKLEYKRHFEDIWNDEEKDPIMSDLSERMGVKEKTRDRSGRRLVEGEEWEACKFYLGFVFRKL